MFLIMNYIYSLEDEYITNKAVCECIFFKIIVRHSCTLISVGHRTRLRGVEHEDVLPVTELSHKMYNLSICQVDHTYVFSARPDINKVVGRDFQCTVICSNSLLTSFRNGRLICDLSSFGNLPTSSITSHNIQHTAPIRQVKGCFSFFSVRCPLRLLGHQSPSNTKRWQPDNATR